MKSALSMAQCEFVGLDYKNKWRNGEQSLAASQKAAPEDKGGSRGSIQARKSRSDIRVHHHLRIFYLIFSPNTILPFKWVVNMYLVDYA